MENDFSGGAARDGNRFVDCRSIASIVRGRENGNFGELSREKGGIVWMFQMRLGWTTSVVRFGGDFQRFQRLEAEIPQVESLLAIKDCLNQSHSLSQASKVASNHFSARIPPKLPTVQLNKQPNFNFTPHYLQQFPSTNLKPFLPFTLQNRLNSLAFLHFVSQSEQKIWAFSTVASQSKRNGASTANRKR
jgi:hypothetical protein